jgi:hypothetical protein
MKDYTVKQSLTIVAAGCGLLLIFLYLFTPLFSTAARSKADTTRLEESALGDAINQYALVFQKYPAGDNAALTKNLTGDNAQQLTLLTLAATSTNKDGQLIDIWSTPYKFDFISTNRFTITSAGDDRMFGGTDDVVYDSSSNALPKP